jgi:hypothetical protein
MSQTVGKLFEYFDRVAIVYLPERGDRCKIPPAPKPDEANGFPSRGVYGSFLSHVNIIHDAGGRVVTSDAGLLLDDVLGLTTMASDVPHWQKWSARVGRVVRAFGIWSACRIRGCERRRTAAA